MRGPLLVLGVLTLAGSARAQSRVVAPVEAGLTPASYGAGPALTPSPASAALPLLAPSALTSLSAIPLLQAPAIQTAIAPALATPAALPVSPAASAPERMSRARAVLAGALEWLRPKAPVEPPMSTVPWSFKLKDGDFYYHGTTLEDLVRVIDSGGEMAPEVSQYSIRSADSIMYAKGRRQKLALPDNPAVLLQFRYDDLRPLVSADAFKADVLAAAQMSYFSLHSAYAAAVKPIPLAMMTPASKDSLLAFLRAQEAARPGEPKWADLRAKFERVLAD